MYSRPPVLLLRLRLKRAEIEDLKAYVERRIIVVLDQGRENKQRIQKPPHFCTDLVLKYQYRQYRLFPLPQE